MKDKSQKTSHSLYVTSEALLRSEIGFWKEMILRSQAPAASCAMERMEQALALAEFRLSNLGNQARQSLKNDPAPANKVSCIRGNSQH